VGLIEQATDKDVTHAAILMARVARAVKSLHELNPRQCQWWIDDDLGKKLAERQNNGKNGRK